jgi:tRNA/rRNA methyltransferase
LTNEEGTMQQARDGAGPASRTVRIVLLRPRDPENLGAVARVMKNFGLDDWVIAALGTHDFAAARRVAVHAEDLLDRPRVVATLDEAVADCLWVVGTSSRRVRGKRRLSPAEVAREAVLRAPEGRTAVVFGDERSGLTNQELDRCHDLSVIPAAEAQPSLNLAQAVLVYAWEARKAALLAEDAPPARPGGGATDAELARIEEALRTALRGAGFLAGPERHAVKDLHGTLRRARLSRREAGLWLSALETLCRGVGVRAGEGRS